MLTSHLTTTRDSFKKNFLYNDQNSENCIKPSKKCETKILKI